MKIIEAKKRVKIQRIVAVGIMATSAILFLWAALKSVYFAMAGDVSAFSSLSSGIQRAIYLVYQKTQLLAWFWEWAPIADSKELNSSGNLGLLLITVAGAIGRIMWGSATNLLSRIAKTILKVEELGWEQELMRQRGQISAARADVLQINIDLKQEDQWYKRPIGLVLLGVAIAILGQLANLKFGLAKL